MSKFPFTAGTWPSRAAEQGGSSGRPDVVRQLIDALAAREAAALQPAVALGEGDARGPREGGAVARAVPGAIEARASALTAARRSGGPRGLRMTGFALSGRGGGGGKSAM